MIRQLIEQFAAGGQTLRNAVAGLTAADLTAHPGPGDWSIHELVLHMADSDAVAINRMKWVIAEDNPPLPGFDENAWLKKLHSGEQSFDDALTLFEVNRRQFARVLRKLPEAAFSRFGTHSERGKVTLLDFLKTYTGHLDHHLKFVTEKRARLGKAAK